MIFYQAHRTGPNSARVIDETTKKAVAIFYGPHASEDARAHVVRLRNRQQAESLAQSIEDEQVKENAWRASRIGRKPEDMGLIEANQYR